MSLRRTTFPSSYRRAHLGGDKGRSWLHFGLKSQPSGGAPADSAYAQRQPSASGSYRSNGGSRRLRAARWRLRQPPKRLDKREPQDGIGARLGHPRPSLRCPGQPRAAGAPPRPRSRQDRLTSTADGSGQLSWSLARRRALEPRRTVGATGRSGAAAWRDGVWPILPLLLGRPARLAQVACAGVASLCCACARRCLRRERPPRRRPPPSVQARASTGASGARRHLPHRHPSSTGRVGASSALHPTLSPQPAPPPPAPALDARASTRSCRSLAAAIDWSGAVCSTAVRPARAGTCRAASPYPPALLPAPAPLPPPPALCLFPPPRSAHFPPLRPCILRSALSRPQALSQPVPQRARRRRARASARQSARGGGGSR